MLHRRLPLIAVGAFVAMVALTSLLAWSVFREVGSTFAPLDGPAWLDAWFHGDSGWYYAIAEDGYSYVPGVQSSIAFFPAYPLLVHAVGLLLGDDWTTAAGLVTLVSAAGAVALFADWVRSRVSPRTAVVAVALLLLYPYSFFLYGSGYSDALFLLTALGSFALLERRHFLLAGLVGILATGGRPVGIAVLVGLVVRAVEMIAEERSARTARSLALAGAGGGNGPAAPAPADPADPAPAGPADPAPAGWGGPVPLRELWAALPAVRWRQAALLLSGTGLVGWMVYLGARFGNPLAFVAVQEAPGWNQGSGPYTWFKVVFLGTIVRGVWENIALLVPQALACLIAVLLLRTAWRRFGWGYAAFALVSLAIPIIGTKDFMGAGRYTLAAFPVIAAAAVVLADGRRPRWLLPVVLVALAAGLCVATVAFAHGVEVS
ncbi:MAG: putative lipoprotein [Modestobacter sp.]|nr:putative lipoprotein [Modestobacter sp.]